MRGDLRESSANGVGLGSKGWPTILVQKSRGFFELGLPKCKSWNFQARDTKLTWSIILVLEGCPAK